jgi:hypothetical protein
MRIVAWQPEKTACLVGDIAEFRQPAALADDIEQIAMLAAGGVGLMCS